MAPTPAPAPSNLRACLCLCLCQELDCAAGSWDVILGERLVKLGLWCCMHEPEQRPSILTIHAELQRVLEQLQQQGLVQG